MFAPILVRRLLPRLWLGCLLTVPAGAAEPLAAAWRQVTGHLYAEAGAQLRLAEASRERQLAEAVLVAAQQPTTAERLREAELRLNALADGGDEVAEAALFLAGRLHQVHFPRPDYARAAEYYETLAARSPGSHWAQLGLVKLALLQLYQLPEPGGPAARLARAEALLPRVTIPRLRRDLHIALGQTRIFYDQPLAAVLADLRAADAIGGLTGPAQGEFYLQLGELSFRAGQWRQSRDYFTRYLELNSSDPRGYTATRRIEEIDARLAAGGEQRP